MAADHGIDGELFFAEALDLVVLGRRIGCEAVDRHDGGHAEFADVLDMAAEIGKAPGQRLCRFSLPKLVLGHAAMHLEGAHGGDDHGRGRGQAGLAAFDVEEFLCSEISAEPGLRSRHNRRA